MLRNQAIFSFGIDFARFMALNDDLSTPTPDRIIGGAGPFDFSSADNPAAIPLSIKLDNGAVETVNVDLSGVADINAVTVAELVLAINTAAPTDVLAAPEAVTGRLHLYYNGTENPFYMQVYGECAELAFIGQGYGCRFVMCDTAQTITNTPRMKEEETIAVTDAKGRDTEIITDGHRKGCNIVFKDTANDLLLKELIESGIYDPVLMSYEKPTSETRLIYFFVEFFSFNYREGSNKEADIESYMMRTLRSCKGSIGDETYERNWLVVTYNITATAYTDENNVLHADMVERKLTVEQYEALDVVNV